MRAQAMGASIDKVVERSSSAVDEAGGRCYAVCMSLYICTRARANVHARMHMLARTNACMYAGT